MTIKYICILSVFIGVAACASGAVPQTQIVPPRVAVTNFDGLGFSFHPDIVSRLCDGMECIVKVNYNGVIGSFYYPEDTRIYGSGCSTVSDAWEPYKFLSVTHNSEYILFSFIGNDGCGGRRVNLKFEVSDEVSPALAGRTVRDMYRLWFSCSEISGSLRCMPPSIGGLEGYVRRQVEGWEQTLPD
jgi:hypothetical protein